MKRRLVKAVRSGATNPDRWAEAVTWVTPFVLGPRLVAGALGDSGLAYCYRASSSAAAALRRFGVTARPELVSLIVEGRAKQTVAMVGFDSKEDLDAVVSNAPDCKFTPGAHAVVRIDGSPPAYADPTFGQTAAALTHPTLCSNWRGELPLQINLSSGDTAHYYEHARAEKYRHLVEEQAHGWIDDYQDALATLRDCRFDLDAFIAKLGGWGAKMFDACVKVLKQHEAGAFNTFHELPKDPSG